MKRLIILLIFLSILPLFAYGQAITIVTEDFPPYNYKENGVMKGVSSEVVLAVLKELNIAPKIQLVPWARAYDSALNEKNYLIYSIARIPEREDLFQWVGAIAPYNTSLYKLKNKKAIQIRSLEDAKPYEIGCSRADVITIYLQNQGFTRLQQVTDDTQNLHKLLLGRVDLIAYDEASFVYKVQQEGLDLSQFERIYRLDELSDKLYMAFSKSSDPQLVQKFQEGLRIIKEKGIFDKIQNKYFF